MRDLLTREVIAGAIVNAAMGMLYVWSLFLLPLEKSLALSRSSLSLAPSLALVSFTAGMMVHSTLLRRFSPGAYLAVVFGLCALGHALFWINGSFLGLIVGYGIMFGTGAGLGYGLALGLAGRAPAHVRSWGIGLVMSAFAVSGTILSIALAGPISRSDPATSFGVAAIGIGLVGIVAGLLVKGIRITFERPIDGACGWREVFRPDFLNLAVIFFVLCYIGLMVMSHSTGMLESLGASPWSRATGPAVFTAAYILGCLGGGKIVEAVSGRKALAGAIAFMTAGVVALLTGQEGAALAGIAAVGMVFGSTASLMPVLIAERYGADRVGDLYGRLMTSYGAAGLAAPWLTGLAFEIHRTYDIPLLVALGLSATAAALSIMTRKTGG